MGPGFETDARAGVVGHSGSFMGVDGSVDIFQDGRYTRRSCPITTALLTR
jgi:hypothetical protein